jgi:undecaprenyl-diphosphatase
MQVVTVIAGLREVDRVLTQKVACSIGPGAGRALSAVEEAAESTKLWWGAAVVMAAAGGWRGRTAAAAGVTAMTLAQLVSNGLCKQLAER